MNETGAPPPETLVPVLVVHDGYTPARLEEAFDADWRRQREAGADRRFKAFGAPCDTRAKAENLIDHAASVAHGGPGVVLIDLMLRVPGHPEELVEDGIAVMAHLKAAYERHSKPLPPSVLWTGRMDALVEYAFAQYGGTHIADRARVVELSDVLDVLWRAVDGEASWKPQPPNRELDLSNGEVELLPFLHLGWRPASIARELVSNNNAISSRCNGLRLKVNNHAKLVYDRTPTHLRPPSPPRLLGVDDGPDLASYCLKHGYPWLERRFR